MATKARGGQRSRQVFGHPYTLDLFVVEFECKEVNVILLSSTTSPISLIRQCVYSYRCISHKRLSIADHLACAVLAGHSVEQLNGLIRRIIECTTVTVLLDTTDLTQVRRVDICIRYSAHANTYVFRCPMPLPQDHTTFTKIRDLWTGKK